MILNRPGHFPEIQRAVRRTAACRREVWTVRVPAWSRYIQLPPRPTHQPRGTAMLMLNRILLIGVKALPRMSSLGSAMRRKNDKKLSMVGSSLLFLFHNRLKIFYKYSISFKSLFKFFLKKKFFFNETENRIFILMLDISIILENLLNFSELFHTERSHVRALRVLSHVFHKPLLESQVLPLDQIQLLFSNLDEMVTIHSRFNQAMKRKKKENPCVGDVGDLLLDMFDGENGETFERAASIYCAKQQVALDALRDRRRKDPKLNSFLNEIEANPLCRRLQLKDHILTGMLRLTKYPLLFENLAKYTPESNEKERAAVLRSLDRSKEILSCVNQAVREAEDYQRLAEIQRTIDRSAFDKFDHPTVQEFKNLDITKRKLIYEGPLQWRRTEQNRAKPVDLHVVLLDDTILLLHRQDEKYLLKFINPNQANSVLSPIVKVSTVLVRHNAVDKNSLYLVNTSQNGAQIYDLVAASPAERKQWFKHISEAAEAYKARDKQGRRPTPPTTLPEEPGPTIEDSSSTEHDNIPNKTDQDQEQESETKESTQDTSMEQEGETPNISGPEISRIEQTKQQQPQHLSEPSSAGNTYFVCK